jgi:NAD(P)-dependent dehydrogenase (short-subunit alcohol dehydrogenase family)
VPPTHASELLRAGVLEGIAVALVGAGSPSPDGQGDAFAQAVRAGCAALGARVLDLAAMTDAGLALGETALDGAVEELREQAGSVEMLVVDAAGLFARASGRAALVACMEASWNVTRALVNGLFIAAEASAEAGTPARRIVYVAPRPDAGEHAEAARAGLENLARTLSVEWSRHGITPIAIAPGVDTAADEVAALVAYLASPAGAYFSGCELDLRGPTSS